MYYKRNGERAGNAALEEIVMAMKTRSDLMPFKTGINTKLISKASKTVSNATGFPVQFNKAIVGKMLLHMNQAFTKMGC